MKARWKRAGLPLLLAIAPAEAAIASPAAPPVPPSAPQTTPAPAAAPSPQTCDPAAGCIPALTPIQIAIDADLGSRTSRSDDRFPIRLAAPIVVSGIERIPAGAVGEGEVIHAKKAGGSGAPGELVVAARWLAVGDRRLSLRSLDLTGIGKDRIGNVNTMAAVAAGTIGVVAVTGFFMKGGEKLVAKGTVASARTAEDFMPARP